MADAWGRSLHGERGLKLYRLMIPSRTIRRSLHGERGLKCSTFYGLQYFIWSLPSRGAWIEIYWEKRKSQRMFVAPFTGSVD